MEQFFKDLRQYLNTLNIVVKNIGEANWVEQLPLFVSAPYIFNIVSILEQQYALCIAKNNELPTPEQISIQKNMIESVSKLPVIFVFHDGSKELCRNLSGKGIGFVIPGKQCFLPGTVVSFREDKFDATDAKKREFFSPMTQMIFLYYLQEHIVDGKLYFQDIINKFDLNKVYVSRTAKELQYFGLSEIGACKRNKYLLFDTDCKALWEKAQNRLINPVWKKIRGKNLPAGLPLAGMSALSGYANLNLY